MHNYYYTENKIQFRRDTQANWITRDPVLLQGELGYDITNNSIKIGNGVNSWNNLPYVGNSTINAGIDTIQGDGVDNTDIKNPILTFPLPSQINLGNVDNTSDLNKPISEATQIVLDNKVDNSRVLTDVPVGALFTDTTYDNTNFATVAQGLKADSAVQPNEIVNFENTAQLNARDINNRNRANHTGTQLSSTISDFIASVRATVLTGYTTVTAGVISATDTVLGAFQKLQAQVTLNNNKVTNANHTGDVTGSTALTIGNDKVTTTKIINSAVTNAKLASVETQTIKGRITAATGVVEDLTPAQVSTMIGFNTANYATSAQGVLADTAVQPENLATVATSGSYNDLSDKPTQTGGGGASYSQMYLNMRYSLPINGDFTGINEATGYTDGNATTTIATSFPLTYIANSRAVIIGFTDFAYELEKVSMFTNMFQNMESADFVVGYRDVRENVAFNANSLNPTLIFQQEITRGSQTVGGLSRQYILDPPILIPEGKQVIIGYRIKTGATTNPGNLWQCGTTLTLKKV